MRHETAIFGPKKPKSRTSSYHFWGAFSFFLDNKKHNNLLKPLFIVLQPTNRISKIKLETEKMHPFFWKKGYF